MLTKLQRCSTAAAAVSHPLTIRSWSCLPVEIQLLILLKVPAAELARLRFVSKSILNLISNKEFAYTHLAQPRPESEYSAIMKLWDDHSRRGQNYSLLKWDVGRDGSAELVSNRRLDIFGTGDPEASGWRTTGFQIPRLSVTALGENSIWLLTASPFDYYQYQMKTQRTRGLEAMLRSQLRQEHQSPTDGVSHVKLRHVALDD
ncbi:hypothetical protein AKJ16_DCAP26782 [Drosera capensis]